MNKFIFVRDDDLHWYMIPVGLEGEFNHLLALGEEDCYASFNNKFDDYRCGGPSQFSFENPEYRYE